MTRLLRGPTQRASARFLDVEKLAVDLKAAGHEVVRVSGVFACLQNPKVGERAGCAVHRPVARQRRLHQRRVARVCP